MEAPSEAFSKQRFADFEVLSAASGSAKVAHLNGTARQEKPTANLRWIRPLLAVAAAMLLLMVSFRYWPADSEAILAEGEGEAFPLSEETDWSKYEVTDPEEALTILAGSLRQVAEPVRTSTRATRPLNHLTKLTNPFAQ